MGDGGGGAGERSAMTELEQLETQESTIFAPDESVAIAAMLPI